MPGTVLCCRSWPGHREVVAEMNTPLAHAHFESAQKLYRQRNDLLSRYDIDAALILRLEQRLRLHLHVLSRCQPSWGEPKKAPAAFVQVASGLSAPDRGRSAEARNGSLEFLKQGGPVQEGAFRALILFPSESREADSDLLELYRAEEELRPLLFRLWAAQGVKVPPALYHSAELQRKNPDLQVAALEYAANRPEVGLELFRCYYQPLLEGKTQAKPPSGILAAVLRGGLLRADAEIGRALRRGIELEGQGPLLRLAALSGDPELYPVLKGVVDARPAEGAELMALYGKVHMIPDLLAALEEVSRAEAAAGGWERLTGQILPRKPRLCLVGQEDRSSQESLPDHEAARLWWSQREGDYGPQDRVFRGEVLTPARLRTLMETRAGQVRQDLLDLLAVHGGSPLGISPEGWMARQAQELDTPGGVTAPGSSRPRSVAGGRHA